MKIKFSKNKKIILLITGLGILTTSIVTPILVINNKNVNQENEDKNDLEKVIKILEEKTLQQRIIILPSDSSGNIVANNKEKIISKLKELIGNSNLKNVSIEVLMNQDQEISTSEQKIIVKISKGKHSKIVSSSKAYFVKRKQTTQEITSDLNFVKTSLENLTTKNLEIYINEESDKTINFNKESILSILEGVKGYSEIDFKDSTIKIKNSLALIPASDDEPIEFTIILSKGGISIEVIGFKIKQLDSQEIQNIKRELKEIKTALESLSQKIVEVHVPNSNFTINHNKINIKNAIKNLNGFSGIDFKGGILKIKDSNQNLPPNNQGAISIILIISKNNVSLEVQGFSAKQESEDLNKVNKIITKIKDKDILIAPNVSTRNQSEIQMVIKNQLKKENQSLNEDDLSKITFNNIGTLTLGNEIEITLIIKEKNTFKELKINVEKINLLKNSNVTNGKKGTIFQDSFGNLWAMGFEKKLQVLEVNDSKDGYVNQGWNDNDTKGLLKNSNINDGEGGMIFQDSFKNLWAMGYATRLQVLKVNSGGDGYVSTGWTNDTTQGLTNGSNIINGGYGTIFQDSFKNLWAMVDATRLQVLKVNSGGDGYVSTGWTNDTTQGLTNGSNIINGFGGTIFQDSFKNLWTMGFEKKLQVLKVNSVGDDYTSQGWTDNTNQGLLNGSNIIKNDFGTIFQDSFKNLWAMGKDQKLQVLKAKSDGTGYMITGWTNDINRGLTNGSNIINGFNGKIFQDSFKNLWAMGKDQKLQVLKANSSGNGYVTTGWTNSTTQGLTNGSNINDGNSGKIFQDSFKNLWAMGKDQKLQVLKAKSDGTGYMITGWTNDTNQGLTNGSNIINGGYGTIFQDSFKNLWILSIGEPLQVLMANLDGTGYVNSWI